MKLLFICTGNTCRSVLAQALAEKEIKKRKLDIICESAGISAFVGDRAVENTLAVLKEKGIDASSHRTRRFNEYMADEFDLFVCMGQEHLPAVSSMVEDKSKVMLLGQGIWDPEDDDISIYRLCADKIEREVASLLSSIARVNIHPMTDGDVTAVSEMEKECFSRPWSENAVREELENENALFFVAELMGERVGYMGMHTVLDECYVANVAVKLSHRRKGIGKSLLKYAQEKAVEKGCSFISLEVRESNEAAIGLYSSEGYERAGKRKNFYSDPTENALIMTKNLLSDRDDI